MNTLFSSESVSNGHPDKVADQISDYLLDAHLQQDPNARVAIETMVCTDNVIIAGEVTSKADFSPRDYEVFVRQVLHKIGYVGTPGFDCMDVRITNQGS